MKTNSTRKIIDYSRTRRKKRVKGIKAIPNTIKVLVNVLDGAL